MSPEINNIAVQGVFLSCTSGGKYIVFWTNQK